MNDYVPCAHCRHHNYTSSRFCGQCGHSLSRYCHLCSTQVRDSDVHCHQCGCKLNPVSKVPEKKQGSDDISLTGHHLERRQVTVQFCDLCGSTDLADRLDLEDLTRLLRLYQDACNPILLARNGFVSRYAGDGIITLFGFPQAHDDAAFQAVAAGIEIVQHLQNYPIAVENKQQYLSVRIGIATGMVLVGDLIGAGPSSEHTVVGQTPNLAARLQSVAEKNTVVVSERTYKLIERRIACQRFGPLSLKGIGKPVYAYHASHLKSQSEIQVSENESVDSDRFVNRFKEMQFLRESWKKASSGEGQFILLEAEPGMGKSRLWREFVKKFKPEEVLLVTLKCSSNATNTPLHPLIDLLLESSESWLDSLGPKFKQLLSTNEPHHLATMLTKLIESLREISVDQQNQSTPHTSPADLFVEIVCELAKNIPIALCLEDAHWADPTTLTMLSKLSKAAHKMRILCVYLARPQARLEQLNPVTVTRLERLDSQDVHQIVNNHVRTNTLPEPLLDVIISKSEGVPLFIEEITHSILDYRAANQVFSLEDSTLLEDFTVPDTLRDLLMARLDSLGDAKRTAQLASVLGREFTLELLASISSAAETQLSSWLEQLLKSGLILAKDLSAKRVYQFKHALIQDAAYDSLTQAQKKSLHAKMAITLRDTAEQDAPNAPEQIASHFQAAGQLDDAAFWWKLAAGNALRLSANREAYSHAQQGIKLIEQISANQNCDHLSLSLHIYLCSAIAGTRGDATPELEGIHAKAASLLKRVNDDRLNFDLTREMHAYFLIRGPVTRACELGRSLVKLAESGEQSQIRLDALRSLGWTYFCNGQLVNGCELLKLSTLAYRKADTRLHTQHDTIDPGAVGLINLAWAEAVMANQKRAKELVVQATNLAIEIEHPYSLTYSLCMGGAVYQSCNEPLKALEVVDQALTIATKNEFQYFVAWGNAIRGWALSKSDRQSAGLDLLLLGQKQYHATGARLFMPHILALRADALISDQQFAKADALLERAFSIAESQGINFFTSEILRLRAVTHDLTGRHEEANKLYTMAAAVATKQGAKEFLGRMELDRSLGQHRNQLPDTQV